MAHAARLWRRAVDRELHPRGLTEATWRPLLHIARAGEPMRQKDLAASLSLDSSSIVRVLDELETAGLIKRHGGVDRRTKAVHLTPLGQNTVQRVEAIVSGVRERALTGVSDADIETVVRVLQHICETLSPTTREDAA